MKHKPLVFLDIETTGASPSYSRITEIGALRVENHKIVGKFNQLVNPEQPIPAFITKMTGISNDMVWQAPTFKGVADDLELFLSDAVFVAHNVNFDYGFIKSEYGRLGNIFNMDRLCSVQLSRKLYPEHRSHRLDKVIERLGITVKNRHRALDDAEVIWKFFQSEYQNYGNELFTIIDRTMIKTTRSQPNLGPSSLSIEF